MIVKHILSITALAVVSLSAFGQVDTINQDVRSQALTAKKQEYQLKVDSVSSLILRNEFAISKDGGFNTGSDKKAPSWLSLFERGLPDLLWILFWLGIVLLFYKKLCAFCESILVRLKHGSSLKIGSFELDKISVSPQSSKSKGSEYFVVTDDADGSFGRARDAIYANCRGVMLVHRITKSNKPGQVYDLIMYFVPHQDSTLFGVKSVQYFFGRFWGNKVFESKDRANGFPISTSAYGPFVCHARINFSDGTVAYSQRYIDFEMGDIAEHSNFPEDKK